MEYTFAILIVFVAIVYSHLLSVIGYARDGREYLSSLTDEKLGNNIQLMFMLVNRDLPPIEKLVKIELPYTVELVTALLVNIIALLYPADQLFNTVMGWIIIINAILLNLNSLWMFIRMRRNKQIVSLMCNWYYNYKPPKATLAEIDEKIDEAFIELMEETQEKEMQKILDAVDKKDNE